MTSVTQAFVYIQYLLIIGINAEPLIGRYPHVEQAGTNEFPFAASLGVAVKKDKWHHYCGAALISKSHILATYNCYQKVFRKSLKHDGPVGVKLGLSDLARSNTYNIDTKYITYNYWAILNGKRPVKADNDVVILTLKGKLPDTIEPVQLSQTNVWNIPGQKVTTVGWGRTSDDRHPTCLHKASLVVLHEKLADKSFALKNEDGVYFTKGDHGGPVLYNSKLIGVNAQLVSFDAEHENIAHHVDQYRDFIESSLPALSALDRGGSYSRGH